MTATECKLQLTRQDYGESKKQLNQLILTEEQYRNLKNKHQYKS